MYLRYFSSNLLSIVPSAMRLLLLGNLHFGVATLIFDAGQQLNFAVPAEQIKALLADAQPVPLATVRRAELVHLPK